MKVRVNNRPLLEDRLSLMHFASRLMEDLLLFQKPLMLDGYSSSKNTKRGVILDDSTNKTSIFYEGFLGDKYYRREDLIWEYTLLFTVNTMKI